MCPDPDGYGKCASNDADGIGLAAAKILPRIIGCWHYD
jgi:hypothetical protein